MLDAALTFDAARHEYRSGGLVIPGVTSLLDQLHSFAGVPRDVLDAAKKRGSAVHAACEYHDQNDLDETTLDPVVAGYLAGWKRFLSDKRPAWSHIEQPVFNRVHRYAGTPDRFGEMGGEKVQVDIKTSAASHPAWGIQTAAYNHAAGYPSARRFTCQLRPDGAYRLIEWRDPNDFAVFVSLITLHNWKAKHA
jgi:hypothetical protein